MRGITLAETTAAEAKELHKVLEQHQGGGYMNLQFVEILNLLTRAQMVCGDIDRAIGNYKELDAIENKQSCGYN